MALHQRLRAVRHERRLTLQKVAEAAGLSRAFLSQVESGKANPSMASLKRIGDALGIPLAVLFDGHPGERGDPGLDGPLAPGPSARDVRVVRRNQRKKLVWPGARGVTYLLTPDLRRKLEVTLSHSHPGYTTGHEGYSHEGEEFGFLLEGRYEVTVGSEVFVLEAGDAIYFPSRIPHRMRTLGRRPAKTFWVVTPPSF